MDKRCGDVVPLPRVPVGRLGQGQRVESSIEQLEEARRTRGGEDHRAQIHVWGLLSVEGAVGEPEEAAGAAGVRSR